MKNKYNIALIPERVSENIINCAQFLKNVADKYILSEYSIPHVTLYQFYGDEDELPSIWEKVSLSFEPKFIELTFEQFSCITFDNSTYWASLLPDHCDELMNMHKQVAEILNEPIKENYDPHMTLISSKVPTYEKSVSELSKIYVPIRDTFIVSLGESDEIGQLTKILEIYKR